jgi:hypothetical protein
MRHSHSEARGGGGRVASGDLRQAQPDVASPAAISATVARKVERVGVDFDGDRGCRQVGDIDDDVSAPARDFDRQIATGPRAQAGTGRFDEKLTRHRPQLIRAIARAHGE